MPTIVKDVQSIVAAVDSGLAAAEVGRQVGVSRERIRQIYLQQTGRALPKKDNSARDALIVKLIDAGVSQYDVAAQLDVSLDVLVMAYERRTGHYPPSRKGARRLKILMSKIERLPDGCWLWLGAHYPNGYGVFSKGYAHRVSYELHVGPIPKGMTIDHLCKRRNCVNPWHFELVTRRENTDRRWNRLTPTFHSDYYKGRHREGGHHDREPS